MNILLETEVQVEHKALYRKYRPNDFSGLVGQAHVRTTLENAIAKGAVSHAYLFTGPRGTGKTSTAKLFAKALNCENPNGCNPCGVCYSCSNDSTDIIEIDAASNNSVDDVRQLKENIILTPMHGKNKIYIVDEVHMYTTQAFNALLKILEEPPAHARFVLATTEVHKIPATILSRCQRFDFRRISTNEIVDRLKYVLKEEGRAAEDTALNLIAQVSAGGMRDALSLLDQALSRKTELSETVTLNDVLELTGAVDVRVIGQLISLIANNQIEASLSHFNKCFESGKEPKFFIEEMMIYLRDILIFKKLGPEATLKKANTDENFPNIAASVQEEKVYVYLNELQETLSNSKFHHDIQLLMEMTIIRMVHGEKASLQAQIDELRSIIINGDISNSPKFASEQAAPIKANGSDEVRIENTVVTNLQDQPNDFANAENKNNNQSTFETSNVDLTLLQPSTDILPSNEESNPESQGDEGVVEVNDPIQFIEMAQEAEANGIDWTKELPPENEDYPRESSSPEDEPNTEWPMPQLNDDLVPPETDNESMVLSFEDEVVKNTSNIILSEKEQGVLEVLQTANIEYRDAFNKVKESIINELDSLNLSSKRVFSEFTTKAVNENTVILVHEHKIQVKLIEKAVHRNKITEAFENVYKDMNYIAITQEEWLTVVAAYKEANPQQGK
ncbi:DNA polymerase III subunit gamma/tau [Lysinibacillus sphaericus]|uniref:DNA polymerase III subunit gamma/tau n=1 Tax=Lysinibacillus sphaericus TaxID=1421 RepID=UPI000C177007|nr:DNA polymerase III subunit gamma/tau [Lysinibacillus sphaericus]PIJ98002.1 DNA polymerase III subunit gamma/tau [Lysinibacillus sphaericus]